MIPAAATAILAVVFATPFGLYAAETWREWPWGVCRRAVEVARSRVRVKVGSESTPKHRQSQQRRFQEAAG